MNFQILILNFDNKEVDVVVFSEDRKEPIVMLTYNTFLNIAKDISWDLFKNAELLKDTE